MYDYNADRISALRISDNAVQLHNIIENSAKDANVNKSEITSIVSLAASEVLGNITPYMTGRKAITSKQIKKITSTVEQYRKAVIKRKLYETTMAQKKEVRCEEMITRLRSRQKDPSQNDDEFTTSVMHDYYQIMGTVVSYMKCKEGDIILGPRPDLPNFKVEKVITNAKDLQVIVLVPTEGEPPLPPIVCCRGTLPRNIHNLVDDCNDHMGEVSFQASRAEIQECLETTTAKYGPAIITGHSLGGAVAQQMAAEFCDKAITATTSSVIGSVFHFNSPGVGDQVASIYQQKMHRSTLAKKPTIISYHHHEDIIPLAGGAHLQANRKVVVGRRSSSSAKEAHCWKELVSEFSSKREAPPIRLEGRITRFFVETVRRSIGKIFKNFLLKHVNKSQNVRGRAKTIKNFINNHFLLTEAPLAASKEADVGTKSHERLLDDSLTLFRKPRKIVFGL